MKTTTAIAMAASLASALPAFAAAPQPVKPVPSTLYSGRWYEIARTQNKMQGDCQASTNDFSGWSSGAFSVTETCHKGAPNGPRQVMKVSGHVLPASENAKMKLGLLGGLISQEYWIVDHADDGRWAIMDRADGRYVWLLCREPQVSAADKAALLAKLKSMGFDMSRLTFPQQPGR